MVVVLFEVTVKKDCMDQYLHMAGGLKDHLAKAEGFIRSERFSSMANEGKLLSLSLWESEEAVTRWRNQETHRMSQKQGRDSMFQGYTITVASPLRVYTETERMQAPEDSNRYLEL